MQGISSIDDNFQGSGGVTQIIAAEEDKQNDSGDYDYDDDNIDCDFEEDDNGDENFDDDETNDVNSSADLELGKSRSVLASKLLLYVKELFHVQNSHLFIHSFVL